MQKRYWKTVREIHKSKQIKNVIDKDLFRMRNFQQYRLKLMLSKPQHKSNITVNKNDKIFKKKAGKPKFAFSPFCNDPVLTK